MTGEKLGSDEQTLEAVRDSNAQAQKDNAIRDVKAEAAVKESNDRQYAEEKAGKEP